MRRALIFADTFVTREILWSRESSDSRAESILEASGKLNTQFRGYPRSLQHKRGSKRSGWLESELSEDTELVGYKQRTVQQYIKECHESGELEK